MSILIKGMKMPESCLDCSYRVWEKIYGGKTEDGWRLEKDIYTCSFKPAENEDGWVDFDTACKSRQSWCPLTELPEKHGRLIDADDLIADYDRVHVGEPGGARVLMENATTIIEAEGDEEWKE